MRISSILGLLASAAAASAASLETVSNWGDNPSNIAMYIYVPDNVSSNPPIMVALHPCGGTGQQWFRGTRLPTYADELGFILIYPSTPNMSNCWDVQSPDSLTHGQGGDSGGIIAMVDYTVEKYNGDTSKIYVMGSSSGGMMTNVMVGSYPDVFEAGAAYSGTAHACFAGAPSATPFSPNQTCAQGLEHTPEEWGNFVRNSYPGYEGRRPRMQIYHGNSDTLVRPQCGAEAMKQWGDVLGVESTQNNTGVPSAQYTEYVFGDGSQLVGYFGQGVGHTAPVNEELMLEFFGLLE